MKAARHAKYRKLIIRGLLLGNVLAASFSSSALGASDDLSPSDGFLESFDLSDASLSKSPAFAFVSGESSAGLPYPITNRIQFLQEGEKDLWLMRQRQYKSDGDDPRYWSLVAILVDKSSRPAKAYYFELAPKPIGKNEKPQFVEARVDCLRCHPNGPRVIRPMQDLPGQDLERLSEWNKRIADSGVIAPVDSLSSLPIPGNDRLSLPFCTNCHDDRNGVRSSLHRRQALSIRYLVENGHMPLEEEKLTDVQRKCLFRWLKGKAVDSSCEASTVASEKPKGQSLAARVSTSLHSFVMSGITAELRIACNEDREQCQVKGSLALNAVESGISLRDRHIREFLGSSDAVPLQSSYFPLRRLNGNESIELSLDIGGKQVTKKVFVRCANSLASCRLGPTSIKLSDLSEKTLAFYGILIKEPIEVSGEFALKMFH